MIRWKAYAAAGAGALVVAGGVAFSLWWQANKIEKLELQNANLTTSMQSLERQADQAREAEAVAEAYAASITEKAKQYDAMREAILRGNHNEGLPDWFRAYLRELGFNGVPTADSD